MHWWENAVHRLLDSEMKNQKHPKAPRFSARNQRRAACCRLPSRHLPSRAPRLASRDGEVDAHSRSGCSDSVTACVRHTAKPSKSQRSAALIYKPHTLCAATQASARAQCPRPRGNDTWRETAQQARGSRTLRCPPVRGQAHTKPQGQGELFLHQPRLGLGAHLPRASPAAISAQILPLGKQGHLAGQAGLRPVLLCSEQLHSLPLPMVAGLHRLCRHLE